MLAALVPVAVVAWIIPIDAVSAAIMIVTLPLVPVFMILVGGHTARRTEERADALACSPTTSSTSSAASRRCARSIGAARSRSRSRSGASEYRRATIATLRISFLSGAVLDLAATLGVALVAVSVGLRLDAGRIGLESALTVLILAPELYLPLRNVGAMYHASADGAAVAGRLLPLAEPISPGPRVGRRPPSPRGAVVRLERVSYAYPMRPVPVLSDVDLELDPGEVVALVGPTGSGKSTVASVLLGFAVPTAGRVTVGGVDLAGCEMALWRRSVAWVPQRPTRVSGHRCRQHPPRPPVGTRTGGSRGG